MKCISNELEKLRTSHNYNIPEIDKEFETKLIDYIDSGGLTKALYNATYKIFKNSYHYDFLDKNASVCCKVCSEHTEWCKHHVLCESCPLNTSIAAARARMEGKISLYNSLEIVVKNDIDLMKVNNI